MPSRPFLHVGRARLWNAPLPHVVSGTVVPIAFCYCPAAAGQAVAETFVQLQRQTTPAAELFEPDAVTS